ncbi:MAG: DUF6745 domain-containing protein [Acidimicrobiales bacterium]
MASLAAEWLEVGLSTEAADRERAVRAVAAAYAAVNLRPPPIVVWVQSPYAGILAAHLLAAHLHDVALWRLFWRLRHRLTARARFSPTGVGWGDTTKALQPVQHQVWDGVGSVLDAALRVVNGPDDERLGQAWEAVRAQAGHAVDDDDPRRVWEQAWGPAALLRSGARPGVPSPILPCYGNHDAGWLAPLDAANRSGGGDDRLVGLVELARSSGWWWPMRSAVVLAERPALLERDDDGMLHRDDGPAAVYRDGWSLHAWHGVGVARWLIDEPKRVTTQLTTHHDTCRCSGCCSNAKATSATCATPARRSSPTTGAPCGERRRSKTSPW